MWKAQLASRHLAAGGRGDVAAMGRMLAEHPDWLSKRGPHNRTLLWEATRRGHLAAMKWLVARGAKLDATGCYNSESLVQLTPYCAAVYYQHDEAAAYLKAQGAKLDIFRATFMGEQARVARALGKEPELLQADDPHDPIYFVPLPAFALVGGQTEMLEFLLERGAPVAPYSAQLLHLAARVGRLEWVEQLIAAGADARAVDSGIFATVYDAEMLRYLIAHGTSATRIGKNGFPPLVYAARGDKRESPETVQLLLEHGAPVDALGLRGRTALHYAAAGGHARVIQVLLDHGAALNLRDEAGATPLELARAAGKTAAAALLGGRRKRAAKS